MARPLAGLTWLWNAIDWIGEKTTLSESTVKPLLSITWGFDDYATQHWASNFTPGNLRVVFGREEKDDTSLYHNGAFFMRIAFPFFIGFMIRWGGSDPSKREYLQTHVGWKLNGRLAIAFRIQSDKSAAAGMDFPNPGQAWGWMDGGK